MKYASLTLLLIMMPGGMFAITSPGGEPISLEARSAGSLYSNNCASCHGRDGGARTSRGRRNHSRNLKDPEWQERVSDERIFNSIMNGKGKMPGYSKKLSEKEIDALVAYVRGLRK
ncbi:MAG TPA: cytochrome c [Pyrinomonadaceae bacterium]|jgi:mono/diheme cytochrome c family protein|nr:cytochrome c [Pyrinomonadaceae bacterium]